MRYGYPSSHPTAAEEDRLFDEGMEQRRERRVPVTDDERQEFAAAHAEGLHDGLPREGCPECPGRHGGRRR